MDKSNAHEPRPDSGGAWWRLTLVASGVLLLVGGSMHPGSPPEESLRESFVTMMSDDAWVPGHTLVLISTILLAVGLNHLRSRSVWPASAKRALGFAATAIAFYCVEAALHLFARADLDRLRDGDFAPVAFTHITLAAVVYPISGAAIAYLAWKLSPSWSLPQRTFAFAGIVGGTLHALSVPLTLAVPDLETSPIFAFAGILIAVWTVSAGVVGIRSAAPEAAPSVATV